MKQRTSRKGIQQSAAKVAKRVSRLANEHGPVIGEKLGQAGKAVLQTKTGRAAGTAALGGAAVGWALPFVSALGVAALAGGTILILRTIRDKK